MCHIDEKDEGDGMMLVAYRCYQDSYVLCLEMTPFRSKICYVINDKRKNVRVNMTFVIVYLKLRLYVHVSMTIVFFSLLDC
jgi:hypothetical protein